MGCFAYSEEDGTPAATMPEQVPTRTRQRRRDELISLQQRIGEEWAASTVGREVRPQPGYVTSVVACLCA